VKDAERRRALLGIMPPDELGAQRRAWSLARAAFAEREPTPWPRRHTRGLVVAAAAIGVVAAILSPPGRAVIDEVRDAVGTERVVGVPKAWPALFSLPAKGRVLVTAPTGPWVVSADGAKRRLGDYEEASWSPGGRHVVVSRRSQLVAVTPKGDSRWSLARPRVHAARWSPSGFRIAYLSGANLRVVAGDGTGDRRLDAAADVAPAWRPVEDHLLAYVRRGGLRVVDADTTRGVWTADADAAPLQLGWSSDGQRLVLVTEVDRGRFALSTFDDTGRRRQFLVFPGRFVDAAFAPDDHRLALIRSQAGRSELLVVDADGLRRQEPVFEGAGRFSDVAWDPGGSWLLLGWESADQWLFMRSTDVSKIKAVSSLRKQFDPGGTGAGAFPRIEGWCCPE